jgi:hypothetical protein
MSTLGTMEVIVFVIGLGAVAVLAMRFGADSRPPAPSKEQDLADLGMTPPAFESLERHVQPPSPAGRDNGHSLLSTRSQVRLTR